MNRSTWARLVCLVSAALVGSSIRGMGEKAFGGETLTTLQAQVDALKMLHDLQATDDQLRAIQQLASDTKATGAGAEGSVDIHATTAPSYASTLTEFRDALMSNNDDKIYAAEDREKELLHQYDIDDATGIAPIAPALTKSLEAIKIFGLAQWARWVAENSYAAPDPTTLLLNAMRVCRGMPADDYAAMKQEAAGGIGLLINGPDSRREAETEKKVSDLLDRARPLDDGEFAAQKTELEQAAKQIVGSIDPGVVMRHWMLSRLADLLSNPQLDHVISERLAHSSDASKKE